MLIKNIDKKFGFTLLECLVALLIISVVLVSATTSIQQSVTNVRASYLRSIASWVASNEYSQIYFNQIYPSTGVSSKNISMAGIDFIEEMTISSTPNPYFEQIKIKVATAENPHYILFTLNSFISQY
jgi:general secretion pathway protein I